MRIALLSDVHANFEALSALSDVIDGVDRVICLGDLVGYYCQVNEVLDRIRSLDGLCVLGNHDQFLLTGCPPSMPESVRFGIEFASRVIEPGHRRWLAGLPLVLGVARGGRSLLLSHGSPWDPLEDYLYSDSPKLEGLDRFCFDVIAFGQTHRPLVRQTGGPLLVNPGSVGQSRQGMRSAGLAVYDTQSGDLVVVDRPYDPGPVIALARQHGAGDWVTKHLIV